MQTTGTMARRLGVTREKILWWLKKQGIQPLVKMRRIHLFGDWVLEAAARDFGLSRLLENPGGDTRDSGREVQAVLSQPAGSSDSLVPGAPQESTGDELRERGGVLGVEVDQGAVEPGYPASGSNLEAELYGGVHKRSAEVRPQEGEVDQEETGL